MSEIKELFYESDYSLLSGYSLIAINYIENNKEFNGDVRLFNWFDQILTEWKINVKIEKEKLHLITDDIEEFIIQQFFYVVKSLNYELKSYIYSKYKINHVIDENIELTEIKPLEFFGKLLLKPDTEKSIIKTTFQNSSFSEKTKSLINFIDVIRIEKR